MGRIDAVAGIVDFFIPAEVISSVLLVFTMENILNYAFSQFVPGNAEIAGWLTVYLLGIGAVGLFNYITADEDELEDLENDFDDLA